MKKYILRHAACLIGILLATVVAVGNAKAADANDYTSLADAINGFDPVINITGNIITTADLPLINRSLTINGNGYTIANGYLHSNGSLFTVSSSGTLTLNNLTLTNSSNNSPSNGGAIYNGGTLYATSCTFTGNKAGNSGGAIFNGGTLHAASCTFTGNTAGKGSAIYNGSNAYLYNCILAGNTGGDNDIVNDGTLAMAYCLYGGAMTGRRFTDGGGNQAGLTAADIFTDNPAAIRAAIRADGPAATGGTLTGQVGNGNNIHYYYRYGNRWKSLSNANTLVFDAANVDGSYGLGAGTAVFDAGINGLSRTLTHAAYNAGAWALPLATKTPSLIVNTPYDNPFDSGNSLRDAVTHAISTLAADPVTFDLPAGTDTVYLNNAIELAYGEAAAIRGDGQTVIKGNGSYSLFRIEPAADLAIDRLTITGGSSSAISNRGTFRAVNAFFTGNTASEGGAIWNNGILHVVSSTFTGNTATNGGAAICNNIDRYAYLYNCLLVGNTGGSGSSDIINGGNLAMAYCLYGAMTGRRFTDGGGNQAGLTAADIFTADATDSPAAIRADGPAATGGTLTGQVGTGNAIHYYYRNGSTWNSLSDGGNNTPFFEPANRNCGLGTAAGTAVFGAGINGLSRTLTHAAYNAGAWALDRATKTNPLVVSIADDVQNPFDPAANSLREAVDYALFTSSSSPVTFDDGVSTVNLKSNIFIDNNRPLTIRGNGQTVVKGAGNDCLFGIRSGNLTLEHLTLTGGNSNEGGAIANNSTLRLNNVVFTGNTADAYGGAIGNSGTINAVGCTFTANTTGNDGGAIMNGGMGVVNLYNCVLTGNEGGDIYNYNTLRMAYCLYGAMTNDPDHATFTDGGGNQAGLTAADIFTDATDDNPAAIKPDGPAATGGTLTGRIGTGYPIHYYYRDGSIWKSLSDGANTPAFDAANADGNYGLGADAGTAVFGVGSNGLSRTLTHAAYNAGAWALPLSTAADPLNVTIPINDINPFDNDISLEEAIEEALMSGGAVTTTPGLDITLDRPITLPQGGIVIGGNLTGNPDLAVKDTLRIGVPFREAADSVVITVGGSSKPDIDRFVVTVGNRKPADLEEITLAWDGNKLVINTRQKRVIAYRSEGAVIERDTVYNNTTIAAPPANPVSGTQFFAGWFADAAFANKWEFATTAVTHDTTLYARWLAGPLAIAAPAASVYGAAYTHTLSASGGTAPYAFALAPGATLPAGLTFKAATGTIIGSPTALPDSYSANFNVTDAYGNTAVLPVAFAIAKAMPAISLSPVSTAYTGVPITTSGATVTLNGSSITVDITYLYEGIAPTVYAPTATPPTDAGTYQVTATTAVTDYFLSATRTETHTIGTGTPPMSLNAEQDKTYDGQPIAVTLTAPAGVKAAATWSYQSADGAGYGPVATPPADAGAYEVTASFAGNNNYQAAAISTTFAIAKATATITAENKSAVFTGSPIAIEAPTTIPAGATLTIEYEGTGTTVYPRQAQAPTAGGTYIAYIAFAGNKNYEAATATAQLTITSANAPALALRDSTTVYDGTQKVIDPAVIVTPNAQYLTVSYSYAGTTAGGTTYGPTATAPTNAGAYTVTATTPADGNYAAGSVIASLAIDKAPQTITFTLPADKKLGDADFTVTATASTGLPITYASAVTTTATINAATGLVSIKKAGQVTLTASQAGNDNYEAASVGRTLLIGKSQLALALNDASAVYTGNAVTHAPAVLSGIVGSEEIPITYAYTKDGVTTASAIAAGTYTVTATAAGNNNYAGASATAILTVTKAQPEIVLTAVTAEYTGDPVAVVTPTVTGSSTAATLPLTYSYEGRDGTTYGPSANAPINAGKYRATVSTTGDDNHLAASASTTISIGCKAPLISLSDVSKTYDGTPLVASAAIEPATLALAYSYKGTLADGTAYAPTSTPPVDAGVYTVTASTPGDNNYSAASATANATISKKASTIQISNVTAPFTGQPIAIAKPITDPAGAALTITYKGAGETAYPESETAPAPVGQYKVKVVFAGDNNHTGKTAYGSLIITTAGSPTLTLPDREATYDGTPKPIGTAAISPSAAEYLEVVYTYAAPGYGPTTTPPTNAGIYSVAATTLADANYEASRVDATLTIRKAPQTISFELPSVVNLSDAYLEAGATATSGLAVTYTSSNEWIVFVNNNTLSLAGAGTAAITATQPGNSNYEAAPPVTRTLTVINDYDDGDDGGDPVSTEVIIGKGTTVRTIPGYIIISGAASEVFVYRMDGRLYYAADASKRSDAGSLTVSAERGAYIVVIGTERFKRIVK